MAKTKFRPLHDRVVVKRIEAEEKSSGGIIIDTGSRDTEKWNTQVAKVISHGPVAYRNRNNLEPWPEGSWAHAGDFVRVPKYGGDRWEVKVPGEDDTEDPVLFMVLNDHEVIAKITGNPLEMKAFL